MAIYKRGKYYWFEFIFKGDRIRRSTNQTDRRSARQLEAACRTALAKGEVGIAERKVVPTLKGFSQRFVDAISVRCAAKPGTVTFYAKKLARLLEFEPLAKSPLDRIDEALIEFYVQGRSKQVAPATVNRELATLRRLLRLAQEWKVIDRVPRIRLLPGERNREFVLSPQQERDYLASAPQPLRDVAMLILDTGLRVGEALALDWRSVRLEPAEGAKFGFFHVRNGKSKNAKRNVPLTARVRTMLEGRKDKASAELVFTDREGLPIPVERIDHWHAKQRLTLKLPADFVLHSLRHTMLTRLGESNTDAFTIMRIAGHSTVVVSQRYVHPSPEAIERAFERLEALNGKANAALKSAASSPAPVSTQRQPVSLSVQAPKVPRMLPPPTNVPTANAATGNLSD